MALPQHQRGRQRPRADEAAGHLEKRLEIDAAAGEPARHLPVHDLLAAEADAAEEPVDRGMEPQAGSHHLLGHRQRPVAPLHVQQLMGRDRALHLRSHLQERRGQEDGGAAEPEGRGRVDLIRDVEAGAHAQALGQVGHGGRENVERDRPRPATSQPPPPQRQPARAEERTRDQRRGQRSGERQRRRGGRGRSRRRLPRHHARARRNRRPGLDHGQQQTRGEQALPVREHGSRRAQAHSPCDQGARDREKPDLQAVGADVREDGGGAHGALRIRRDSSARSRSVRRRSWTSWTRSGSAEPPKTRSRNSRTIAPTTCRFGRTDW